MVKCGEPQTTLESVHAGVNAVTELGCAQGYFLELTCSGNILDVILDLVTSLTSYCRVR